MNQLSKLDSNKNMKQEGTISEKVINKQLYRLRAPKKTEQ